MQPTSKKLEQIYRVGGMGAMGALMEHLTAREAALAAGLSVPPIQRMINGKILANDL